MQTNSFNKPQHSVFDLTRPWLQRSFMVFFAFFITACGGGGGDISRDPTNPADPNPQPTTLNISLTIANADSGDTSDQLSANTPLRVTAAVTNAQGAPQSGELVTFNFSRPDLATFSPASGTALTNAEGAASIVLNVGTLEGSGLVTAQLQTGEIDDIGFNSAGDLNDGIKTITLSITSKVSGEPDNALTLENPLIVNAVVQGSDDAPINDELIIFTFNQQGLARFVPDAGTALTSPQGAASIELVVGADAGAGIVFATLASGETAQIGFTSTGGSVVVDPPNFTLDLTVGDLGSGEPGNQLSRATPLRINTVLTDINGDPVVDQLVTYTLSNPDLAVFEPENGETLTDENGISTIILGVGTVSGDGLITATIPTGESGQIGFSSAGDADPGAKSITLEIVNADSGEEDNVVSPDNPLTVRANVVNGSGVPLNDELIQFSVTDTNLAVFEPASGTALTDPMGSANIGLRAGQSAGAGLVIATLTSGETAEIGFNSTGGSVVVDPPDFTIDMTINELISGEAGNRVSADTPLQVTATITDITGAPVVDQLVSYTFSNDTLAVFDPVAGETLTDAQGVSRITLRVGSVAGDGLVFATLPTGEQAQIGFSSAGDQGNQGKEMSLSIVNTASGEPDNNLSSANPLTIRAQVVTSSGDPVVDELLTFSLSDTNLAFLSPASGTALTDASGLATMDLLVGLQAGAGKVFVTLESGEMEEIGFNSAGDGQVATDPPATLDFFTSSLVLASSGSDQVELIALVKDEDNILMEGIDVQFSSDSGELSIVQGTTLADGTARAVLTSQNNPENRTITVTSAAGDLSQSLSIEVTGTVVNINAPNSVILNDTGDITIILANSDGVGIPNQAVSITSNVAGALAVSTATTDETGQVTVTYNAVQSGVDTITVTALNASSSQDIIIQEDVFGFTRATSSEVTLNTNEAITITWLKDNVPFEGGNITFTTTRGTLSANTGTTDANGQVTIDAQSATAGNTIISATGVDDDGGEVSARIEFEYIATDVDSIIVSASPSSIGPGGQKSTVTAVVRDMIGNLVKGVTIGFTADDISGGDIFPPTAVTDRNGLASTVFTSNTVTSEDAVVITATHEPSGNAAAAEITVADRALFISLGTGNSIESPDSSTYLKRFSLFVTDANSNPVANVDLTVSGTPVRFDDVVDPGSPGDPDADPPVPAVAPTLRNAFFKGFWEQQPSEDAFEFWAAVTTVGCPNEDWDSDGILDEGEDVNGDGNLTPGNVVAIDGNISTDANGQAEIVLRYPKSFGAWVTINIIASTPVAGSENRVSQYHRLGVSATDATVESSPPNVNPFGQGTSCEDTI